MKCFLFIAFLHYASKNLYIYAHKLLIFIAVRILLPRLLISKLFGQVTKN